MPDDIDKWSSEAKSPEEYLAQELAKGNWIKVARFILRALGSVPFVGGSIAATADAWSEAEQDRVNNLVAAWMKLKQSEFEEIQQTMLEVMGHLSNAGNDVRDRIQSPEYMSLVRRAFRNWSAAESETKRRMVRNLLTSAAASRMVDDDVVAMFLDWIDRYSELHFKVIRLIHQPPDVRVWDEGATRGDIWRGLDGDAVREDSAEADLFSLVIDDLSRGHIARQWCFINEDGDLIKATPTRRSGRLSPVRKSAFNDDKPYVLTALGQQFVDYAMTDPIGRIEAPKDEPQGED